MAERAQPGAWVSPWITVVLGIAALASLAYGVTMATGIEDNEALESPLALAVARQLVVGPWQLYGPYGRGNTLVMIHSPLYYHLAALVAWPVHRGGLGVISAGILSGRLLSMLSMGLTLWAIYRLARLDGVSKRAGRWAGFIFAALPVVGMQPYSVRPDILGVCLQTTGVYWVLAALESQKPQQYRIVAAYVAFGLAFCVKLHFIVGAIVCTCLLLRAHQRGRVAGTVVVRALLAASAIVLLVYGTEELATGGRMSHAVFLAAVAAGRVHPSDWQRAMIVLFAITGRGSGLIALVSAVAIAGALGRPGVGRRVLAFVGFVSIGLFFLAIALDVAGITKVPALISLFALLICVTIVIPVGAFLEPQALARGRADLVLWTLCAGELILATGLARASTGAWVNYGLQAVACGGILAGRALARLCEKPLSPARAVPIALAALFLLLGDLHSIYEDVDQRLYDRASLARLAQTVGRPSAEFFFAGRPGYNRAHGRPGLVYDDWLYPVFESMHLAEPRSSWLRIALTSGDIRFVVTPSDSPEIEGLGKPLDQLGYMRSLHFGPFFVWEHLPTRPGSLVDPPSRESGRTLAPSR